MSDQLNDVQTRLPGNAIDAHAHVFGAPSRHPGIPERMYELSLRTPEDYLEALSRIDICRGVLTAASAYGTDNTVLLDALDRYPDRLRGVAHAKADITQHALEDLDRRGVRGARINLAHRAGRFIEPDEIPRFARKLVDLKWHIEFVVREVACYVPLFRTLPVPYSFSHFGLLPITQGLDGPDFRALLDLLRDGNAWVKLTGSYRVTRLPGRPPYEDVRPFALALIEAAPERMLWGTDWPHFYMQGPCPDDADLLAEFLSWTADPRLVRRILVDNPTKFYDFRD